jgi:non-specific serine/threonine protein kinase
MTKRICVSPTGQLFVEDDGDQSDQSYEAPRWVSESFARSSAEGLLALATRGASATLAVDFLFWRDFAQRLLHDVVTIGSEGDWSLVASPPADALENLIRDAPPMRGLEYLSAPRLDALWRELRDCLIAQRHAFGGTVEDFLKSLGPLWHDLGRVTFHLAENKRDARFPFAFMATYAHRVAKEGRLAHLPLAEALRQYAGKKDQAKLAAVLSPIRRAADQCELVRTLLETKAVFQPQAWTISEAHRFLKEAPTIGQQGIVVRVPNWWQAGRPPRPEVRIQIGNAGASRLSTDSLLDFSWAIALDGERLTESECREILRSAEGLVLLRGKWVEVDRDKIQQALDHWQQVEAENPDGLTFLQSMRLLSGADTTGGGDEPADAASGWTRVTSGAWLAETLQKLRDPSRIEGRRIGRGLSATLRPYQQKGVHWLWFMNELGMGGCLADDMGLGKTIQIIALLVLLKQNREKAAHRPSLLIVPASLLGNWKAEIERFAPSLSYLIAHRSELAAPDMAALSKDPQASVKDRDIVITTYALARRLDWLKDVPWRLVVLDEAQAIKNAGSAQSRAVKKIPASGRFVLTGTPVENHLGDLWSLFDFCCPGLLGTAAAFKKYVKRIGDLQRADAYAPLRRLVQPYILRRMKTDPSVVPDLPDKIEMLARCSLVKQQAVLYAHVVEELQKKLKTADGMARKGLVLATLMQLKQICNHPSQFLGDSKFAPSDSGKFSRLAQLCEPIAERQEKVLVFTQFRALTQALSDYLRHVFGRPGLVLHGGTSVKKRQDLVHSFQDSHAIPYFVISLKAGGSGLNLTAASHVVHFDRWWNPAVENQATDRAFRIGQKKNVLVHKFVCRGTVEERIDQMISRKREMAEQLLDQGAETLLTEMDDKALLDFVSLDLDRATADD